MIRKESKEKICFITGASGRLGKEIAIALAKNGHTICFTYLTSRSQAKETLDEIRESAPNSIMVQCDIAKVKSIETAFGAFQKKFSRLDLVITNASNFFPTELPHVSEKDWDSLIDTNLKGTFFTMQCAAQIMEKQNFTSRIITITDVSAELTWRRFAPYSSAKAGVQHLTRVFAKEFAPKILVNSIAPGTLLLHEERDKGLETGILKKIPLKRFGSPSDIIKAVLFLADTDYITGHTLNVDGGRVLY